MLERRHRVFFAVWPDADEAEHLHALGADLVRHARGGGRTISVHDLHMTLAFAGAVTQGTLDDLIAGADRIAGQAHEVKIDRLGFWPRGGVVYAAPSAAPPSRQRRLQADLANMMRSNGIHLDHRPWAPHVTLARTVRGIELPRLGCALGWRADCFVLAASHLHQGGARYEILNTWPLADDEDDGE